MGTRSLTFVKDGKDKIINMYRQYDGYPSGHGKDLYDFLKDIVLVNGIPLGDKRKIANGMGCLAAQLVAHFKEEPGNNYLYPVTAKDCGQEYVYTVYGIDAGAGAYILRVKVEEQHGKPKQIFDGSVQELGAWLESQE